MDVRSIIRAMGALSASRSHGEWIQSISKIPEIAPYIGVLRNIQGNRVAYSPDKKARGSEAEQSTGMPSPVDMLNQAVNAAKDRWKQQDREQDAKPLNSPIANAWRATRNHDDGSDATKAVVDKQLQQSQSEPDTVSKTSTAVDSAQMALDAVGFAGDAVVPGLGVAADGLNAGISVGRVFTDPGRAKEHATNAAISLVGMIPFIGDAAKLLKTGRYAKTAQRVAKFADKSAEVTGKTSRAGYRELAGDVLGGAAAAGDGGSGGGGGDGNGGTAVGSMPPGNNRPGSAIDNFADKIINATDAVMKFAGPLGKAYLWMQAAFKSSELAGAGVLHLNRGLSEYSGSMAAVYADYDIAQINRSRGKGDALAGPTSRLSEQLKKSQELNDAIATPLNSLATDGIASVLYIANTIKQWNPVFQLIRISLNGLNSLKDMAVGDEKDLLKQMTGPQRFLNDAAAGKFDGQKPTFTKPGKE